MNKYKSMIKTNFQIKRNSCQKNGVFALNKLFSSKS